MVKHILVVNPNVIEAEKIKSRMGSSTTEVVCAYTIQQAIRYFDEIEFCLVILDANNLKQKRVTKRLLSFVFLFLLGSNRQDVMIAQLVALSDVCFFVKQKANSPLSAAKQCRMVRAQQGEPKMPRKHRFSGLFLSLDWFENEDKRKSFG